MEKVADSESLSVILSLVRTHGAIGRPELQRVSGLGRGIVAERVNQLLRASVIAEADFGASTGGRAARELRVKSEAGRLLVCYASLTDFDLGIADLSGRLLTSRHEHCDFDAGPNRMVSKAKSLWQSMIKELGSAPAPVWGIGLGIPAHIDFASARLVDLPSLPSNWNGYDLRGEFSESFGAPVWIDTLDNLLVLGELRNGAALGHQSIIYLYVDMAVGSGLVLDGRLYRGAQGAAGNVGHITSGGDAVCRCGRRGCVEAVAGGEALIRQAMAVAHERPQSYFAKVLAKRRKLTLADLGKGVRQGDADALDIVSSSGEAIGRALAVTVNVLNPSLILIGGRLMQVGDVFLASLKEALLRHSLPFVTRELRVVPVERTEKAGLVGVAHMIIDELFSPTGLAHWFPSGSPAGHKSIDGT